MNNLRENAQSVQVALRAVRAHCMCASFEESATHYRVLYPAGYFPDGVQAAKEVGKAEALRRMEIAMERHWKNSNLVAA